MLSLLKDPNLVSLSVPQLYHHPADSNPLFDLTKRLYRQLTSVGFVFKDNTHRKVDRISCWQSVGAEQAAVAEEVGDTGAYLA